jgi:nucleoside-diphosphate-sugar epimerase
MTAIVILGAGGYLGSNLCRFFHAIPGYRVIAVSRRPLDHRWFDDHIVADVFAQRWSSDIPGDKPIVLINCAFDFRTVQKTDHAARYAVLEHNIAALCQAHATRLINISTMSAFPRCRTAYGREKLYLEALFAKYGGTNVRPGLIMSWHSPGAAFLNLVNIVQSRQVIPIPSAVNSGFFLCDLEAVVLGIYFLSRMKLNKPHLVSFCYGKRLKLVPLLSMIGGRYGVSRLKISVPWQIPYLLLRVIETFFGRSKVRADSIIDFAYPATVAYQRKFFARMIGVFRGELEALSSIGSTKGGLCFLEEQARDGGPERCCRAKPMFDAAAADALRCLADTQRIG